MAWETGVLAAFEDLGVDLTKSDLVIGSSAGSFVGSALLSRTGMVNFLEIQKRSPNSQLSAADVAAAYQGWRQ
jgi:NTE family protein